jgi:hypothetical protein
MQTYTRSKIKFIPSGNVYNVILEDLNCEYFDNLIQCTDNKEVFLNRFEDIFVMILKNEVELRLYEGFEEKEKDVLQKETWQKRNERLQTHIEQRMEYLKLGISYYNPRGLFREKIDKYFEDLPPYNNQGNTAFGFNAGYYAGSFHRENIYLGSHAGYPPEYRTAIGKNAIKDGENGTIRIGSFLCDKIYLGDSFLSKKAGNCIQPVYITNEGQICSKSDSVMYKRNIEDIKDSELIHKLNPVKFSNILNDTIDYGLISEDVKEILPELVHDKSVNYNALCVLLLKQVQNLKKEIENLKK